jgi:transposase InsO family protein
MKRIAEALEVSRSRLHERATRPERTRPPRYCVTDDAWLLPLIREIVDGRPTYGYRRACAVLNRRLAAEGRPAVNHKRVYRIMRQHSLLLARHTGQRPQRSHEGKVVTLRRNLRWSSDVFEIPCLDGSVVRVAFALDCCDREVISHVAASGGISGEMVRDLMVECVERRFGQDRTPHPVEWLSDNGSCYTARETLRQAADLGLRACFTPVRSPESNGMAEAFVKTFKRDYVFVHDRPDAITVMAQLANWFEDYNEHHPHKGLRMKSPREFIRLAAT